MQLPSVIQPNYTLRETSGQIYSVLPRESSSAYDGRAKLYDAIVGSRIYNRLLWGCSIDSYHAFVRQALNSKTGKFLDVGSGSAVFTAEAYSVTERPITLLDLSTGMLQAAKQRISDKTAKSTSEHVTFIQADIFDLPFNERTFSSVLSMGMLHLFDKKSEIIDRLLNILKEDGQLYLTSLVNDRKVGEKYLSLLHKSGEVAEPCSFRQINSIIKNTSANHHIEARLEGNMAYFIITKR